MIPFSFRLLGFFWACHLLFLPSTHITQYFYWISSHIILGFLSPFYSFGHPWPVSFLWAFLACFIPLSILGPFHSLGHPWPISLFPTSYIPIGFCQNISSFPPPNYYILYFWVYWHLNHPHLLIPFFGLLWPISACFLLLMILMGLLLLYLGLPWAHLFSLGPFYYFVGLCIIIPAIQA